MNHFVRKSVYLSVKVSNSQFFENLSFYNLYIYQIYYIYKSSAPEGPPYGRKKIPLPETHRVVALSSDTLSKVLIFTCEVEILIFAREKLFFKNHKFVLV